MRISTAQANTYMLRLGQLKLGNIVALWATFGTEECQHGPFHIFGSLWNGLNQGQALGILAKTGTDLGATLNLALLCEHVLARESYLTIVIMKIVEPV